MDTYLLSLTHPDLDGAFIAQLVASTEHAAKTRIRMCAMQSYRHAELLHSDVTVLAVVPGIVDYDLQPAS